MESLTALLNSNTSSSRSGSSNSAGNNGGLSGAGSTASQKSDSSTNKKTTDNKKANSNGLSSPLLANEYPDWKLELTMERLRQKVQQTRSFGDLAKNIHSAIIERRTVLDVNDKQNLQKSLDILQQNIKVNSLQSMVERLEMISRQNGLRFHSSAGSNGKEWFVSSEMFFLELLLDSEGVVQEVKIQHDGKSGVQNCPEITKSLQNNDFVDFAEHLSGLVSIYQLTAEKNIKSKVFIALQALETDLSTIASTYSPEVSDGDLVVMKSLLGIVKPRTGGHPLKLIFYISPYEFLDPSTKSSFPNDTGTIIEKQLGTMATVSVQASSSHKLQMSAIVTVLKTDGRSSPRYGTLNATNSTALPACFTFNLQKPIALCKQIVEKIHAVTGIQSIDLTSSKPILSLVTEFVSEGKLDCTNGQGLFVALPDQLHCYYMTETEQQEGIMASTISFTLASQIPQIIALLRQQLAFNTLIGSCVRVGSEPDISSIVFEINALSYQNITVQFQHPLEDSLVTMEFDIKDVTHPHCRLHAILSNTIGGGMEIIPTLEEHACRVIQRSMSIPVTLRAVIRRWQSLKPKYEPPNPTFELQLGAASSAAALKSFGAGKDSTNSCRTESDKSSASHSQQPSSVPTMVSSNAVKASLPARPASVPVQSTLTISPVPVSPSCSAGQLDALSSYMNPMFKALSAQFGSMPGLHNLNSNAAFQMLASQLQQQAAGGGGKASQSSLLELLDQARGSLNSSAGKKRKRKSSPTEPVPILPATSSNTGAGGGNRVTPPSPVRQLSLKSPKRRMSESSNSDSERVPTPNTLAREMMMSEYGLDSPTKWNLDITPVPSMESYMATKLLSSFGAAAASGMIKQERPDTPDGSGMECQFTQPRKQQQQQQQQANLMKRPREHVPKRSMSLDSSQLQNLSSSLMGSLLQQHQLQQQQQQQEGGGASQLQSASAARQMVPPSLSITPVACSTTVSSNTAATVNSILASMKPGIEIIPLHSNHPITIPNSITVTPIVSKPSSSSNSSAGSNLDKKPSFQKKLSAEEFDALLGKQKKKVVAEQKRKGSFTEELLKKGVASLEKKPGPAQKTAGSLMHQLKKPSSPMSGITTTAGSSLLTSVSSPSRSSATGGIGGTKLGSTIGSMGKIGSGKPSVTTLKSATGSTTTITNTTAAKAKPKEKKVFSLTPSSSSGGVASPRPLSKTVSFPPPPTLRPMFDLTASLPGSTTVRSEPTTPTGFSGGGSASANPLKGNNKTGFVQTGTVTKKPGGLLAGVIDKLKSQQSVESDSSAAGKKELSRLDYLKASSTITTEMQKVKGGAGNGGGGGTSGGQPGNGSSPKAGSPGPAATASAAASTAAGGAGQLLNPEYMVKPGGQGLKLTINKTAGTKDKAGGAGTGKVGVKRTFTTGGPLKTTATTTKLVAKKPKLESPTGSVPSPGGQKQLGGKGSPGPPSKPKEQQQQQQQQLDLTKKLFQPGAVRSLEAGVFTPKFDSNFQIPKKSRTVTPPVTTPDTPKEFVKDMEQKGKEPSPPAAASTNSPTAQKVTTPPAPEVVTTAEDDAVPAIAAPSLAPSAAAATLIQTPESPDAPNEITMDVEDTPRIPTTPLQQQPSEPELPVLENTSLTNEGDGGGEPSGKTDSPDSPHESTPPVLELQQQQGPASPEPASKEPTGSNGSGEKTTEMPPPRLPPLTPEPSTTRNNSNAPASPAAAAATIPSSPSGAGSGGGGTASITSIVHIVHSPQPNSPIPANILLRSPLVAIQSPHSVHAASPYAIDDDLMDEALVGSSGGGGGGGNGGGGGGGNTAA